VPQLEPCNQPVDFADARFERLRRGHEGIHQRNVVDVAVELGQDATARWREGRLQGANLVRREPGHRPGAQFLLALIVQSYTQNAGSAELNTRLDRVSQAIEKIRVGVASSDREVVSRPGTAFDRRCQKAGGSARCAPRDVATHQIDSDAAFRESQGRAAADHATPDDADVRGAR